MRGNAPTTKGQRVALVHRFFRPDVTSYALMLDRYAEHLAAEGHHVTVLTTRPSYNGAYQGPEVARVESCTGTTGHPITVRRLRVPGADTKWGKVAGSALFPAHVALHCWTRRRAYDVVSVTTVPPVLMGVAGRVAAARSPRSRFVYHCMDLYPEVASAVGLAPGSLLARFASRIDTATVRAAQPAVVLSDDMATTLENRGLDLAELDLAVANNFVVEPLPEPLAQKVTTEAAAEAPREPGPFRLIFAGNLGRFQGIDTLLDAVEILTGDNIALDVCFLGAGALDEWIVDQAASRSLPVRVLPHRPLDQAMAEIANADLGVVSLAPGVINSAYPSKTMTYLTCGVPVLAVVEGHSDLARTVEREHLGVVATPGDSSSVAAAVHRAMDARYSTQALLDAADTHFGEQRTLGRWTRAYGLEADNDTERSGPLIIIGAGRSGTNALRDALTSLKTFSTWPCDEINYVWRSGNRDYLTDELTEQHATPRVRRLIRRAFERQAAKAPGTVLVEKTCANSLRVGFVDAVFPEARFVVIERDGRDVVPSAMKRWTAELDIPYLVRKVRFVPRRDLPHYGLRYLRSRLARSGSADGRLSTWGPRFTGLDTLVADDTPLDVVCAEQWAACTTATDRQIADIDPDRVLRISYERFVSDPSAVLREVAEFAGATVDGAEVAAAAAQIHGGSVGGWERHLDAEQIERVTAIVDRASTPQPEPAP